MRIVCDGREYLVLESGNGSDDAVEAEVKTTSRLSGNASYRSLLKSNFDGGLSCRVVERVDRLCGLENVFGSGGYRHRRKGIVGDNFFFPYLLLDLDLP